MIRRASIPQPTRIESAARIATVYLPVDRDDLAAAKGIALGLAIVVPLWAGLLLLVIALQSGWLS